MTFSYDYIKFILTQDLPTKIRLLLIFKYFYRNFRIFLSRIKRGLKKESNFIIVESIEKLNCDKYILYQNKDRKNNISKPSIYNKKLNIESLNGNVPDISIYIIDNVTLLSKTSSIIVEQNIYNYYLSKMNIYHDFKNVYNQSLQSIRKRTSSIYYKDEIKLDSEYNISLMAEHSLNYYHFITELLPKLILICDIINSDSKLKNIDFNLLIDKDSPSQIIEIVNYFCSINKNIILVPKHSKIYCKKVIFCTDFWDAFDNTKFKMNLYDFFVDKFALSLIENKIKKSEIIPTRKIYFQRKYSQGRYLKNTIEVEKLLKEYNFEFIFPENLSFDEQIKLMSEASIVVGVSGAVFTNMLFMKPNTKAIIFAPDTISSSYYIFQPIADIAKVNLIYLLTKNKTFDNLHEKSHLNINDLSKLLIELI